MTVNPGWRLVALRSIRNYFPAIAASRFFVMSVMVFSSVCILACGFLIYAAWQWTREGNRRKRSQRSRCPYCGQVARSRIAASIGLQGKP